MDHKALVKRENDQDGNALNDDCAQPNVGPGITNLPGYIQHILNLERILHNGQVVFRERPRTLVPGADYTIAQDTNVNGLTFRRSLVISQQVMVLLSAYWQALCQQWQLTQQPRTIIVLAGVPFRAIVLLCSILHNLAGGVDLNLYASSLLCIITLAAQWSCLWGASMCNVMRKILDTYLQARDKIQLLGQLGLSLGDMIALAKMYKHPRAFWYTTNQAIYHTNRFDLLQNTSQPLAHVLRHGIYTALFSFIQQSMDQVCTLARQHATSQMDAAGTNMPCLPVVARLKYLDLALQNAGFTGQDDGRIRTGADLYQVLFSKRKELRRTCSKRNGVLECAGCSFDFEEQFDQLIRTQLLVDTKHGICLQCLQENRTNVPVARCDRHNMSMDQV